MNVPWMSHEYHDCNLNVTWMYRECHLNVPWMCPECLKMFQEVPECIMNVIWMSLECIVNVTWMYHECHLKISWMSPECNVNVTWMWMCPKLYSRVRMPTYGHCVVIFSWVYVSSKSMVNISFQKFLLKLLIWVVLQSLGKWEISRIPAEG